MMKNASVQKTENRLFNLYRTVCERENSLSNEAKIVQYGAVLRYLMTFIEQNGGVTYKIYPLIYKIDLKLGDIYYDEGLQNQDNGRYFLAAQYYNQALTYAVNSMQQSRVLSALRDIYYYLDDEEALFHIESAWAVSRENKDKCAAFLLLARNTLQPKFKISFLEGALDAVAGGADNFYEKYQNTLHICSQLIALYELTGEKEKAYKINRMREETLKLLN